MSSIQGEPNRKAIQKPNTAPLNPSDSMKLINLPEGFSLELVASEPQISEPVALTWDGNGKMYVVEMRGYMQSIDGAGAKDPVGRVSLFEDTNGDGHFDKHSVFLDGLVEPRAVLYIGNGLLVGEPSDLWYCRDTDGDGKSDTKDKVYDQFSLRESNVEHKANGLILGIDNWVYVSQHGRRYQFQGGEFRHEKVPRVGQWGLARNDEGRFLFSSNSVPAMGLFIPPEYLVSGKNKGPEKLITGAVLKSGNYNEVWPSMKTTDLQSGVGASRTSDGTLRSFTAACGQSFFRADGLGEDVNGDYFICEPVGRLVRRSKVKYLDSGHLELLNPYEDSIGEFITSNDGNFRPVNTYTGPDGCLYVVDMYRGVIQEKSFMTPYLKQEILKSKYDKNIGRGRIYRIKRDDFSPGKKPDLLDAAPEDLVTYLKHSNGWWRDMAQSIIVNRRLFKLVPLLNKIVMNDSDPLARLHALWTLRGLSKLEKKVASAALKDADERIVSASLHAINWSPSEYPHIENIINEASPIVIAHIILAVGQNKSQENDRLILKCISRFPMNERVLRSVLAVTSKEHLKIYRDKIISNPVFQGDTKTTKAGEWLKRWDTFCLNE
ncbi:MAG: PVC-type heme-binding CxxCH protein [Verrucomicrobiota bacterium]|nr:PVC-type heme-binding CxxCH protein [Verrucomicrobiota bacterium]MEE2967308.1 PVC-type heme-binding CxxCH protein [Verrucomicrobiota bacterium]